MDMTTYHIALVSSARDIDAATVESEDRGEGVRIRYGTRHGSQTREAFAYELDAGRYTAETARAYMQGRGIDVVDFRAAKSGEPKYVEIEYEVARTGKWKPNVFDADGNQVDAEIEFTPEMFAEMVETFEAGKVPNKLGHTEDMTSAREVFGQNEHPMGVLTALRVAGEALVARARVPQSVKEAIDTKWILQRSIEASRKTGRWILDAVAWLKTSTPAVQGMPDAQVAASIFATAQIVLDVAPTPGGPETKSDGNREPVGAVSAGSTEPDPDKGEENDDMSDDAIKTQLAEMLSELRASACQRVDDLTGKKITPAQAEQLKAAISEEDSPKAINRHVQFAASGPDLPDLTRPQGDATPPKETPNATDDEVDRILASSQYAAEKAKTSEDREQLHTVTGKDEAKLQATATTLMRENRTMTYAEAVKLAARANPQAADGYLRAAQAASMGREV